MTCVFHTVSRAQPYELRCPRDKATIETGVQVVERAQARQAAFELDESDLGDLPDLVNLLMDGKAREFLATNSRSLHQTNGAADAARLLTELHRATQ